MSLPLQHLVVGVVVLVCLAVLVRRTWRGVRYAIAVSRAPERSGCSGCSGCPSEQPRH